MAGHHDPVGAIAVLPEREQAAFDPDQQAGKAEQGGQDDDQVEPDADCIAHEMAFFTIWPQHGSMIPSRLGKPAGSPATPRGRSGRSCTGSQ